MYDCLGRDSLKIYTNTNNVSRTESYVYNNYGYLDQIKFNGTVVYDVSSMDTRGNITGAYIGGTPASWGYDSYGILTGNSAYYTMGFSYTFNATTGNLTSRSNPQRSLTESFVYDNLDRLDSVQNSGITTLRLGYDTKGNITTKSDAGTLLYDNGKPYQVAHVNPFTPSFSSAYQNITYTTFGKVNSIEEANYSATFKYNADNERIKMVFSQSGVPKTKYYFGSSYEKVVEGSTITEYIWIGGSPYTAIAVAKIVNGGTPQVWAIFRDHLGSITHVKNGSTIQEYSFDAYGRRRDKDNWSYTLSGEPALFADRGFTGHEHLEQFGVINMNGRLYDPLVGRFLSPDNYVQAPDFTQSFNRYGYCLNNPLKYTDQNGEWFFSLLFPPAAPVLIYVDAFLWGATIDYASQLIDNMLTQRAMGQKINWGDALWNDIDFIDAGVSGLTDAATLGIGKITKLPNYAKIGLKAATIFGSNTAKAHVDYKPGTGWNTSKSRDEINAELWASNVTSLTLGKTYDFGIDKVMPKKMVGDMLSDKFSERLQNFAVKTLASPALNNWNRSIYNDVMRENNYYYNFEKQRWENKNYEEQWWKKYK